MVPCPEIQKYEDLSIGPLDIFFSLHVKNSFFKPSLYLFDEHQLQANSMHHRPTLFFPSTSSLWTLTSLLGTGRHYTKPYRLKISSSHFLQDALSLGVAERKVFPEPHLQECVPFHPPQAPGPPHLPSNPVRPQKHHHSF